MKCINALYGHLNTVCELEITDKYLFSGSFDLINVIFQLKKVTIRYGMPTISNF
jgi:hypothetical protein